MVILYRVAWCFPQIAIDCKDLETAAIPTDAAPRCSGLGAARDTETRLVRRPAARRHAATTNDRIVQLIYTPEPKNWPEHETPMAPMPQVPKEEALKIASWINSLRADRD